MAVGIGVPVWCCVVCLRALFRCSCESAQTVNAPRSRRFHDKSEATGSVGFPKIRIFCTTNSQTEIVFSAISTARSR